MASTTPLRIAVLVGSVRRNAFAPKVAAVVVAALKAKGVDVSVVDPNEDKHAWLATVKLPFHHAKGDEVTADMQATQAVLAGQDAVVVVAGEYNHAPSPAALAILDNFHRETWGGKVAGIVAFGGQSAGGARAAITLRTTLAEVGCLVVPSTFGLSAPWSAISEGKFVDEAKAGYLDKHLDEVISIASAIKAAPKSAE